MDPFSVFDRLGQRRGKSKTSSFKRNIEISGQDYLYVPSEAFNTIAIHDRFSHLNAGLYVGLDLLEITDENRETLDEIVCFIDEDREGMLDDITWWEAKAATQELGGRMLTIPEYVAIYDYLKMFGDTETLDRMNPDHQEEWLDTRLSRNDVHMHGKIVDDGKKWNVIDEILDPMSLIQWKGYFYPEHLDTLTGIPIRDPSDVKYTFTWYEPTKDYYYDLVTDWDPMQVVRCNHKNQDGNKMVGIVSFTPGMQQLQHGVRLCYDAVSYESLFPEDVQKDTQKFGGGLK